MTKKERAEEIQKIFDVVYADAECSLDYSTEHELLVAVQLSAQCTDARVNTKVFTILRMLIWASWRR